MTKYFIWKNMGSKGKDYRNEQIKAKKILQEEFKKYTIELEYPVRNLTLEGHKEPNAKLDIVLLYNEKKYGIRVMGGIHTSSESKRNKDKYQKLALEEHKWVIIDFWEDEMPNLWSEKSDNETYKLAKNEVLKKIGTQIPTL